jgi:hypothetical protein
MFKKSIGVAVLCAVASSGCATIFNKQHIDVRMDPGVAVDGATGSTTIDQKEDHVVTYQLGGAPCTIESGVSVAYIILDIFLTGPIGLIIDGVTGNWTVSKGGCDGVYKE